MKVSIDILEAEGELNREITSALIEFRRKVADNVNKIEENRTKDPYDTSKEGSEKVFRFRESLLSLKFEINDYKTIYNMMAASFLILAFCLVYDNYITKGSLIDVVAFKDFFRGWEGIFLTWWLLAFAHFTIIPILFISLRNSKMIWIPLYIAHQAVLIHIGVKAVLSQDLGFASVFIALCETIRMVMKSHSYFRTKMLYLTDNKYKDISLLGHSAPKEIPIKITLGDFPTEVYRLSYFFIIPTLIYRDCYTLTPSRSMSKIFAHLINFLSCIYYGTLILTQRSSCT
jgi:sterol O-acyltransferase